jgi:hypothetical protein
MLGLKAFFSAVTGAIVITGTAAWPGRGRPELGQSVPVEHGNFRLWPEGAGTPARHDASFGEA